MTDPQARHLNEMFGTLDSGRFQALIASGLLTDLRRCAAELDPTKVDRDEYQRILGVPSLFTVKMGGPENTDQITAALGFPFNEWINQANFPLTPAVTPWEDEIEIVDPGRSFSEEEGLVILAEHELDRPTYEHGIRFGQQHGATTTSEKKPFIIFLHEAWRGPRRRRRVVSLIRRAVPRARLALSRPRVPRPLRPRRGPPPQAASALGRLTPQDFWTLCPFARFGLPKRALSFFELLFDFIFAFL